MSRGPGGISKVYDDLEPLIERESVRKWLNALRSGGYRKGNVYALGRYVRWLKSRGFEADPDRLIDECLNGNNRVLVDHVSRLLEYCQEYPSENKETVRREMATIRSFYLHNFVELPHVRPVVRNGNHHTIRREITAHDFLEYINTALHYGKVSVRDRAVILAMLQSGMDASTLTDVFNLVGYPQLLNSGVLNDVSKCQTACPIRIDLVRPKSDYRYYTFLDIDAVETIAEYLKGRDLKVYPGNPGELPHSDPIFIDKFGHPMSAKQVTSIFLMAGRRAKINIRDPSVKLEKFKGAHIQYAFHSHECRDTLITMAKHVGADMTAANFFLGHSIDKLKYDKSPWNDPEHYRKEYMKIARPWLNPASGKALETETRIRNEYEERLAKLEEQLNALLASGHETVP